ncbi:hypothetical protein QAD02_006240 [Eretmocerus hayati]|uniref:Uncharacterized protein n=1 Tax=Eretmocerus hayati TaxID=131215 RepID=A0ACC2N1E5_9HYME|nr:hypothetical protein QAD02_006240 [Eretmocerus hayati]
MDAIQERPSDPFPAPLFTTVQHKKIKRRKVATNGEPSSTKSLDEVLTSIVPFFDNSEKKLSLTFHKFSDLIKSDLKNMDGNGLPQTYPDLEEIIDGVYPLISEPKIKSRLTRIKNKLKPSDGDESVIKITDSDTDTDLGFENEVSSS